MAEDEAKKIEMDKLEEEIERAGEKIKTSEEGSENQVETIKEIEKSLEGGGEQLLEQQEQHEQAAQESGKKELTEAEDSDELKVSGGIGSPGDRSQASRQRQKQIERLLEEGLADLYLELPDDKKQVFKKSGEETARKINNLIESGKAKAGKIIGLIKEWLSLIPGVNNFFIEQEAKKKADKIIELNKDDSEEIKVL